MEGFYALTVHNLFWQNSKCDLFPDLKFPYWDTTLVVLRKEAKSPC